MPEKEDVKPSKPAKEKITGDLLLENFVALQRVLTDVSVKLTNLTQEISHLLKLFESAAKNFKEKKEFEKAELWNVSERVNQLVEQNKIIAQGLSLVEEELTDKPKPKSLPEFRF